MIVVNIHEAKAKLSEFLEAVSGGERVLICKRNQPVAELRAVAAARSELRPVGLAKGRLAVPDVFFEPLPAHVTAAFDGESFASPAGDAVARAAERPKAAYAPPPAGRRGRRRS